MNPENPKAIFGMDIRALSIFRIALALLIIYDLTTRFFDLTAHYTDSGILPRQIILNDNPLFRYLYIHFFSGSPGFEVFVFIAAYLFAILLLLGYKTRFATIASWYFLISLHARNHFILYGSDILFRMILFWSMFLPLGLRYSIDSLLNKEKKHESNLIFSGWTIGYLIQIAFVYFFTAILKNGTEWHEEKSAIYYALNLEIYARPFADSLLQYPKEFLKLLTSLTLWFEYAVPFLLLSPVFVKQTRIFTILGLVLLHLGFNTFLDLGHFGICSVIAMIPLFPINNINGNISQKSFSVTEKIVVPLLIIYILTLNISAANPACKIHKSISFVAKYLQLDQSWGMFAPHPAKENIWPVAIGKLKNKETVNLLTPNQKEIFKKPDSLLNLFPNIRWRSFITLITKTKNFEYLGGNCKYYSKYLCEKWNRTHKESERLEQVAFYFMQESNAPEMKEVKPTIIPVLDYNCNSGLAIDINYARILTGQEIKTKLDKFLDKELTTLVESALGQNDISANEKLIGLANIYRQRVDLERARMLYKLVLLSWIQNTKEGAQVHIKALNNLSSLYKAQDKKSEIIIIEGWERLLELITE